MESNHYNILNECNHIGCMALIYIVYSILLLDNMLLTIVVPILPTYIADITNTTLSRRYLKDMRANEIIPHNNHDNYVGIVLATKAFFQLIFNPIVGKASHKMDVTLAIFIGACCLLTSSLVFAFGIGLKSLILAQAIHGIASAFITINSMSLVAQICVEQKQRSKFMGITLGSMALGVLLGYPFGSVLYDLFNEATPFLILSVMVLISLVIQVIIIRNIALMPLKTFCNSTNRVQPNFRLLLQNEVLLALMIAIWLSTSTIAILELCLPTWLIMHLKSRKWQLGFAFIPDSLGYFIGTNFFASIAYTYEPIKVSCYSLILVGISSILIPFATSMYELLLPHFCLGLGIGIIDAALVPLMAKLVDDILNSNTNTDSSHNNFNHFELTPNYGTLYAIQQTSVSLAYLLAPLIGTALEQTFGFTWVIRTIGFLNVLYGPILAYLYNTSKLRVNHLPIAL